MGSKSHSLESVLDCSACRPYADRQVYWLGSTKTGLWADYGQLTSLEQYLQKLLLFLCFELELSMAWHGRPRGKETRMVPGTGGAKTSIGEVLVLCEFVATIYYRTGTRRLVSVTIQIRNCQSIVSSCWARNSNSPVPRGIRFSISTPRLNTFAIVSE